MKKRQGVWLSRRVVRSGEKKVMMMMMMMKECHNKDRVGWR
jgi:hypothetical protein